MIRLRLFFACIAGFFLAGCAGTHYAGGVQSYGHHSGGFIGISGTVPYQQQVIIPGYQPGMVQGYAPQAICDNGKTVGVLRSTGREVCAYPNDPNVDFSRNGLVQYSGASFYGGEICDNNKLPGTLRSNGQRVCAYPGDRNVIFSRGYPGYSQYGDYSGGYINQWQMQSRPLTYLPGCNGVIGYDRMTGQEVCSQAGDPRVVFAPGQGGKNPFGPECQNGGRYINGRYICMD